MRITGTVLTLSAAVALAGCGDAAEQQAAAHHGRYLGIGVYPAGQMWSRVVVSRRAENPVAASTADDEQVIVVVDSHTGEVRQCGNLTGWCIGMNPWRAALGAGQAAPVAVTEHAGEIGRESEDGAAALPDSGGNAATAEPKGR